MERALERRFRRAANTETGCGSEELGERRLNLLRVALEQPAIHAATDATAEQRAILKSLRLADLVDDNEITAGFSPRVVSKFLCLQDLRRSRDISVFKKAWSTLRRAVNRGPVEA